MTPTQLTDPQLGPALALVALRKEFQDLPAAKAVIGEDGHLELVVGSLEAFNTFQQVIGGEPWQRFTYRVGTELRESTWLTTVWRDVRITLTARWTPEVAPVRSVVSLVRAA